MKYWGILMACIAVAMVLMRTLICNGSGEPQGNNAKGGGAGSDLPKIQKTPTGSQLPEIWKYTVTGSEQIKVAKKFTVTITISSSLFDVSQVTITPFVNGSGLTCVRKDKSWDGTMLKGESQRFEFELVAAKAGFAGQYGVKVVSTSAFENMKQYLVAQTSGKYASSAIKADLLASLQEKIRLSPVYRDGYVAAVDAKASEDAP